MRRAGIFIGLAVAALWLAAQPVRAASPEPAEVTMKLTTQLSAPGASEFERDLLRREYRLSQTSSEFWAGFDSLNARIHGAADLLRSLRGRIEGAPPSAWQQTAAAAETPIRTALPLAPEPSAQTMTETGSLVWGLGAAVLGMLTLILLRRRLPKPVPQAAAVAPSGQPIMPSPDMPPPKAVEAQGLGRMTVPAPQAEPPKPIDPVREEMDHALDLADVMLTYGRTTAAMQTLKDYLNAYPDASLRPWLKLLDLHRQTGMREDFERAAETVHSHFNIRVPHWDEGVAEVPLRSFFDDEECAEILGLEQLPHILAKVQATWPDASCLEYLRHLLVDNRGGGRQGFPVSVVSDILLLEDILTGRLTGQASPN